MPAGWSTTRRGPVPGLGRGGRRSSAASPPAASTSCWRARSPRALLLREDGTVVAEALVHCRGRDYLVEVWPDPGAEAPVRSLPKPRPTGHDDVEVADVRDEVAGVRRRGSRSRSGSTQRLPAVPGVVDGLPQLRAGRGPDGVDAADQPDRRHRRVRLQAARAGRRRRRGPRPTRRRRRRGRTGRGATCAGWRCASPTWSSEVGAETLTPFDVGLQWMVDFATTSSSGRDRLLDAWQRRTTRLPVCWRDEARGRAPSAGAGVDTTATGGRGHPRGVLAAAGPGHRHRPGGPCVAAAGVEFADRLGRAPV